MKIWILIFCVFGNLIAVGQKPNAFFLTDSVRVGSEVQLVLSLTHDSHTDILFPDSSSDFSPFIYVSTQLFETKTNDKKSVDSAIYTLVSYSLDSVLSIAPFVHYVKSGRRVYADTAKIAIKSLLNNTPLELASTKSTIEVFKVNKELNVPLLLYYILGFAFVLVVLVLFFGSWMMRQFKLWKFDKQQKKFVHSFKKQTLEPKNIENIQTALNNWKNHIEWIDKEPVSTMSTSEIFNLYNDERLESALRMFDTAIFGQVIGDQLPFAYHILHDFARKRYLIERQTIQ